MKFLQIKKAWIEGDPESNPVLNFITEKGTYWISPHGQKLLDHYGFPYVAVTPGSKETEDLPPIVVKKDSVRKGVPEYDMTLNDFTDDPRIVELAKKFLDDWKKKRVKVGPIKIPKEWKEVKL